LHLFCGSDCGQWQRHVPQIADVEAEIDGRALGTSMTEEIADRLEISSLAEQMHGQGVPQAVRPSARGKKYPGAPRPRTECVSNPASPERTKRKLDSQEDLAARRGRSAAAQIVEQRRPGLVGQRQQYRRTHLGPWDADLTSPPSDIVDAQSADLARPQTVGGDQQKHREVAQPLGR
jgi:hypothetical protein